MAVYECSRKDGTKYFMLEFRDENRQKVREAFYGTLGDARKKVNQRRAEVQKTKDDKPGGYVNPRKQPAGKMTFADFATKRFIPDYAASRRSTYYADALTADGPIVTYFGKMLLGTIDEAALDGFKAERSAKVGPSTVRKNLTVLSTMFKWAKRWKLISTNPAADLDKPSEPKNKTDFVPKESWATVEKAAPPWLRDIMTFAVSTGMRLGEITGLRQVGLGARPSNGSGKVVLDLAEVNQENTPHALCLAADQIRSAIAATQKEN